MCKRANRECGLDFLTERAGNGMLKESETIVEKQNMKQLVLGILAHVSAV